MATLQFRRIESNFENMRALIEGRLKLHEPKSLSHQVEMLKNYKGHLRMRSKPCEFISSDHSVETYDRETYSMIKPQERTMIESEMVNKTVTRFKSYLELRVSTRMSGPIWDDSFNMRWEQLEDFFKKFGLAWSLNDLVLRRQMTYRHRFAFFNFIGRCLTINDTVLVYKPELFDFEEFKFTSIYLN